MKPIVLCIMDGWGLKTDSFGNSPLLANTPVLDSLFLKYPNNKLSASEKEVGLPMGQMGNSEVGHVNIGAGRIVYTGLSLVNKTIEDDNLKDREQIKEIFELVKKNNSNLHILSLASYGGVHAHLDHFYSFAQICKTRNQKYFFHAFTDGRDVSPNQALLDFEKLTSVIENTNGTLGVVSGRYYAMDRDQNWNRTTEVYEYLTGQTKSNTFDCPINFIKEQYGLGITDEFIKPAINKNCMDAIIKDNDVVVFLNYRPDRAKQLSHLFVGSKNLYEYEKHKKLKNIGFFALLEYEGISVTKTIFPHVELKNTLGEVLSNHSISQLRIAETEKYPHVTHFFDGGKGVNYPKMKKILIPSPKVATYDLKPEMSAPEITDALLNELQNFEVVILNFANPDMVGHSGSLPATIKACETVDTQVGRIYKEIKKIGGTLIIIADHGNAEVMMTSDNKPHTAHTINLVPIIICKEGLSIKDNGKLGDIAPTILELLNIVKPVEMTGNSLLYNIKNANNS